MASHSQQRACQDIFRWRELAEDIRCKRIESAIQAYHRALSAVEDVWGVDRLPYLVDADLRQRWRRGIEKLNEAVRNNETERVRRLVDNMIKGLRTMITAAQEAGHSPLGADVWEARLADGRVLRLVRGASNPQNDADGRDVVIWSLEEVARVVEANTSVNRVKQVFPGAVVTNVEPRPAMRFGGPR